MYFAKQIDNINYAELLQHLISLYFDHDYESLHKILNIEKDENLSKNKVFKYKSKGMTFCDNDNPLIYTRIYIDEETKHLLNTMLMITSKLITEKTFIDLVIDRWIKNVSLTGLLKTETPEIVGKETYVQLKVGERCWNDFTEACKNKGITVKIGFKMLLLRYSDEIILNIK